MKIAFCLKNELSYEKICQSINKIITNYINEGNNLEDGLLVVEIAKIKEESINLESKI